MENGYHIHSFSGTTLAEHPMEKFKQLVWRPRPPTLLSKEEQKKIRKNLREYSREFEEEDRYAVDIANTAIVEERKRLLSEWTSWLLREREIVDEERDVLGLDVGEADAAFAAAAAARAKAEREAEGAEVQEGEDMVVEEIVEEIIEEHEEIVA